jgi:hypothetical protein
MKYRHDAATCVIGISKKSLPNEIRIDPLLGEATLLGPMSTLVCPDPVVGPGELMVMKLEGVDAVHGAHTTPGCAVTVIVRVNEVPRAATFDSDDGEAP